MPSHDARHVDPSDNTTATDSSIMHYALLAEQCVYEESLVDRAILVTLYRTRCRMMNVQLDNSALAQLGNLVMRIANRR